MNQPRQVKTPTQFERNPQPLKLMHSSMFRGHLPGMRQASASITIEVRGERIKRTDPFHNVPAVRSCLASLPQDRLGVRWGVPIEHSASAAQYRHAVEQLGHILVAIQESAGFTVATRPLITAVSTARPGKSVTSVRMICPSPLPALLIRMLPEIVRVLNVWLSGKPFETLHSAIEKVIVDLSRFAPQGQNMRLLLDAAYRLDVPLLPIAGRATQFGWGSRARWLDSSITDCTPAIASRFARDKRITNRFLGAHGVPVPKQMDAADFEAALAAAEHLRYPVAVKPANLDGGVGVTAGVKDAQSLRTAYDLARQHSPQVIIESHIVGEDVRVGFVNGEIAWATTRTPAGVIGDGVHMVQQLIDQANRDPRRGVRHWSLMSPMTVNAEAKAFLKEQGIALTDVPQQGRFVQLRSAANISSGGVPRNIVDQVHPDNCALVKRVCRLMRLDIAGVDLIMPDITRSWREVGGAICEVNAQPQFTVEALDLPFNVMGGLFKGNGRIPTIVLLGDEASVSADLLHDAFRKEGLGFGLVMPTATLVNGQALQAQAGGAFTAVQSLLVDPDVDCIVALVDDESWLNTGAPLDRIDLLYAGKDASAPLLATLKSLQTGHVKDLAEAQLTSADGASALAKQAAALLDWHDRRPLPVERVTSAALSASPLVRKAPPKAGSIGLCMIAKNEAAIITQSLESVRALVDYVLVEDTGSSDGTQEVVRQWLRENGIPGAVIEEPWRDFGWNRTHALAQLRRQHNIDYALILDADDVVVRAADFDVDAFKAGLTFDVYDLDIHFGALRFQRPQLLRNAKAFGYRGVLHEFVEIPQESTGRGAAAGLRVQASSRGARSQNSNKYEDDIALLEGALKAEHDLGLRARYMFYLAQSLQDAGHDKRALQAYTERASLDFWPDEMFVAAYRSARLMEKLERAGNEIEEAYRRAIAIRPQRLEAYHGLCRFYRLHGQLAEALAVGREGLKSGKPDEAGLFVDHRIYCFGLLEEAAIAAGLAGLHMECVGYCEALLARVGVPAQVIERIGTLLQRATKDRVGEILAPVPVRSVSAAPRMQSIYGRRG